MNTIIPPQAPAFTSLFSGETAHSEAEAGISSSHAELSGPVTGQNAAGHADFTENSLVSESEECIKKLDEFNGDMLMSLKPGELSQAERLQKNAEKLLLEGPNAQLTLKPGAQDYEVAQGMRRATTEHPTAGFMERGWVLLEYIGGVLHNDSTFSSGDMARRAGNLLSVATRTGTIVALTTVFRQMVGFTLERYFQGMEGTQAFNPRMMSGYASLLIGPAMNIAGAIRDERNDTATNLSRISRTGMLLLSLCGLLVASSVDPVQVIGTTMSSVGPQLAAYTLARDFLQIFFPLHENGGMNVNGLVCSSIAYGLAQVFLSEGLANLAPQSGAEHLIAEAGRLAAPMATWAADVGAAMVMVEPNIAHDLLRAAMNSLVEMFDEVQRPSWMRYFGTGQEGNPVMPEEVPLAAASPSRGACAGTFAEDNQAQREGVRIGLGRTRLGPGNWPTSAQVADNMLTTCAMRTSIFEAVVAIAVTVSATLKKFNLNRAEQCHMVSALIGTMVIFGYPFFTGAHLVKQPERKPAGADDTGNEMASTAPGMP